MSQLIQRHVFWLFGLSGAGKTTLAIQLTAGLRAMGRPVLALDGDELRTGLCRGLGFSDADRAENLRRAAEVAKLGLNSDVDVVAAFITPLETQRAMVAAILPAPALSFIHVSAPLSICQQRDVKGLYARARDGAVPQMTGFSAPFESPAPEQAHLTLQTDTESVAASTARLLEYARGRAGR